MAAPATRYGSPNGAPRNGDILASGGETGLGGRARRGEGIISPSGSPRGMRGEVVAGGNPPEGLDRVGELVEMGRGESAGSPDVDWAASVAAAGSGVGGNGWYRHASFG